VLELRPRDVAVITCVGDAAAMDALGRTHGAMTCRVAPDETMLLTSPEGAAATLTHAHGCAAAADGDALVLDATDGWSAWTLRGDQVDVAFGRLSAVPLRPGFSQGDVAHVPVKIVAAGDTVDLLVPAMWRAYLRERILARCADLQVVERMEPTAWTVKDERS
jgi:hypothetical protein